MPNYIRAYVPGGTYFFTVALLERQRNLLTDHIGSLRASFRQVKAERPFKIEAIVILPDHLHCIINFVKHGLVKRLADWPYSSFHHFVKLGFYTSNWAAPLDIQEWVLDE